ncbi:MAG: DUF6178 family protein [Proteobacteria bacterium]|nr:DUF6178 family protein [Pseudomonadota bacterium]
MSDLPSSPPDVRRLLELARSDRPQAERALAELSLEQQVSTVCDAPLATRARLLELLPHPEDVIPALPEAELCFTARAVGLADASWILEHATPEQVVACLDLDAWRGLEADRGTALEWLTAIANAGEATLLRAAQALDPELLVLILASRTQVVQKPNDDEGWEPPVGGQTLEGQFYLTAVQPNDDLAPILRMLNVLFRKDYWLYFRLLQGMCWELESDLEEWSLRWRTGRLEDLGFPAWDQAFRIYAFIRPERRADLLPQPNALDLGLDTGVPARVPEFGPAEGPLARAVSELEESERHAFFQAFMVMANKIAVADRMPLGDAETLPGAVEKASLVIGRGLEHVARENDVTLGDALRRQTLERLFQVGANLDPETSGPSEPSS